MAQTSWPFENEDTSETQYSQFFRNLGEGVRGAPTGTELQVTAGSGVAVSVAVGEAMVRGHYYSSTTAETLTLTTPNSTNPRIDTVVLRLDPAENEILLAVVAGTPGATPTAPTLTQTDTGVFELPLADVLVPAAALAVSTITDRRKFLGSRFGIWSTEGRPTPTAGLTGYNTTTQLPEFYDGTVWTTFSPAEFITGTAGQYLKSNGTSGVVWDTLKMDDIATDVSTKSSSYTITSADKNTFITVSSASTITVANVLAVGESINFIQTGTGQITFAAGSGVTLLSKGAKLKTAAQYSAATVVCTSSGTYHLIGDLTD
jgi:hypothetical protein